MTDNTFPLDNGYHITLSDRSVPEDRQVVREGLSAFNQLHVLETYMPLILFIRDENNAIKGGLLGTVYWNWCAINSMWIDDALRGKGYGTRLVQIVAAEATRQRCLGVHLDVTTFQGKLFFQKLGYTTIFGQLEDMPIGHSRYSLKKPLGNEKGAFTGPKNVVDKSFPLDNGYHITVSDQHLPEEEKVVSDGLDTYNRSKVEDDYLPLNLYIRDERGMVKGGLLGATYWGWCAINVVWIHEDLRHKRYGTHLIQLAEDEAKRRGCHGVYLDTMSFQTLPFYQKLGYTVFGQIDDLPMGHAHYYLKKSLK